MPGDILFVFRNLILHKQDPMQKKHVIDKKNKIGTLLEMSSRLVMSNGARTLPGVTEM